MHLSATPRLRRTRVPPHQTIFALFMCQQKTQRRARVVFFPLPAGRSLETPQLRWARVGRARGGCGPVARRLPQRLPKIATRRQGRLVRGTVPPGGHGLDGVGSRPRHLRSSQVRQDSKHPRARAERGNASGGPDMLTLLKLLGIRLLCVCRTDLKG